MESVDVLFLLLGAVMILAMHAGFAFLEAGTVNKKNQVNAFNKIIFDWSTSTLIYFLIGFPLAYGIILYNDISILTDNSGYDLVRFFFLVGFAACIPAIISGGIVGRMKFFAQSITAVFLAAIIYPFFESLVWGRINFMGQKGSVFESIFGNVFHDFAGSVVVHSIGGWIALTAIITLGARKGRYSGSFDTRPSNIPFLALGSWILIVGWFGFNVMSAQKIGDIQGLVAINSLMAMIGGTITGLIFSKNDVGFTHNGALAGLIAICAGSDVVHPLAALFIGGIAGIIFVIMLNIETNKLKIDDVLGVWPLHGINGTWGGIAAGIFGRKALGGVADLSFMAQLSGSLIAIVYGVVMGFILYKLVDKFYGLRMTEHEELIGSDLVFHSIESNPEESL
ncbi:MAG: ammonium transporter [Clostridiales bacterium]